MAKTIPVTLDAWSRRTGLEYTIRGRCAGKMRVFLPPDAPQALHVCGEGETLPEAAEQALRLWDWENREGGSDGG